MDEQCNKTAFRMAYRQSMCYCSAADCKQKKEKNSPLSFFSYPRDEKRCREWIIRSQRTDLLSREPHITRHHCLCEDHFEPNQFMNPKEKGIRKPGKRLIHSALPTLFKTKTYENPLPRRPVQEKPIKEVPALLPVKKERGSVGIQSLNVEVSSELKIAKNNNEISTVQSSALVPANNVIDPMTPVTKVVPLLQPPNMSSIPLNNPEFLKMCIAVPPSYVLIPNKVGGVIRSLNPNKITQPTTMLEANKVVRPAMPPTSLLINNNVNQLAKSDTNKKQMSDATSIPESALSTLKPCIVPEQDKLSILRKKIRAKNQKVLRLTRRYERLSEKLKTAEKNLTQQEFIDMSRLYLSGQCQAFFASQIKMFNKQKQERKWSDDEKAFARSIYDLSPRVYKMLQKIFALPTLRTLKRNAVKKTLADISPSQPKVTTDCEFLHNYCKDISQPE